MQTQIKYINHGIGFFCSNRNGSWIELNKNLKKYPELHQMVLNHELEHAKSKNKHIDFMQDFMDLFDFKKNLMLMKFMFRHPSALLSASPIFFSRKGVSVNWFMFLLWGIFIICGGLLI